MSFIKKLLQVDKRLAGSFAVAVALAIIFFLVGQLYDKQPRLRYVIVSQSPVYDVHEDVPDLDILFRGTSIRQQHETLSVINLRIENSGNADLNVQSFDPKSLPGMKITNSKIVKITPQPDTDIEFFNSLQLTQRNENEIVFGPTILNRGEVVALKFLVLHNDSVKPEVQSFNRVAGGGKIDVITSSSSQDQRGFFARALSGNVSIQAFRTLAYFIFFIAVVGATAGSVAGIASAIKKRRRRKLTRIFERTLEAKPTKQQRLILDLYKTSGASGIVRLNEMLGDSESVARAVNFYRKYSTESLNAHPVIVDRDIPDAFFSMDIGRLMNEKLIQENNGTFIVDPLGITAAREFEEFLLHHDPEKVLQARGRRQREAYGTEEGPASEPESRQPREDENVQPSPDEQENTSEQ